jgi:hypothetical protein
VWKFTAPSGSGKYIRYSFENSHSIWTVVGDAVGWQSVFDSSRGVTFFQYTYTSGGNTSSHYDHVEATLIDPPPAGISAPESVPLGWHLFQNFPNPFNPSTTIRYGLPNRSHVTLAIYTTLGQQVALLQNGEQEAGYHEIRFDASALSSGVYFYRIQAEDFVATKRLLLLK